MQIVPSWGLQRYRSGRPMRPVTSLVGSGQIYELICADHKLVFWIIWGSSVPRPAASKRPMRRRAKTYDDAAGRDGRNASSWRITPPVAHSACFFCNLIFRLPAPSPAQEREYVRSLWKLIFHRKRIACEFDLWSVITRLAERLEFNLETDYVD